MTRQSPLVPQVELDTDVSGVDKGVAAVSLSDVNPDVAETEAPVAGGANVSPSKIRLLLLLLRFTSNNSRGAFVGFVGVYLLLLLVDAADAAAAVDLHTAVTCGLPDGGWGKFSSCSPNVAIRAAQQTKSHSSSVAC